MKNILRKIIVWLLPGLLPRTLIVYKESLPIRVFSVRHLVTREEIMMNNFSSETVIKRELMWKLVQHIESQHGIIIERKEDFQSAGIEFSASLKVVN